MGIPWRVSVAHRGAEICSAPRNSFGDLGISLIEVPEVRDLGGPPRPRGPAPRVVEVVLQSLI